MAGRTTIIISHNLVTVTDADTILFLDHGQLIGTAVIPELLESLPAYAHLYRLTNTPQPARAHSRSRHPPRVAPELNSKPELPLAACGYPPSTSRRFATTTRASRSAPWLEVTCGTTRGQCRGNRTTQLWQIHVAHLPHE